MGPALPLHTGCAALRLLAVRARRSNYRNGLETRELWQMCDEVRFSRARYVSAPTVTMGVDVSEVLQDMSRTPQMGCLEVIVAREDRGFASMDRGKQKEIASKGGRAAHVKGTAHEWTSEEAREAGRKGGMASHRRKPIDHRVELSGAPPSPPAEARRMSNRD